jgi:hypothetical protein
MIGLQTCSLLHLVTHPRTILLAAAHTLDFQGRVKESSIKNFQLIGWDVPGGTASGPLQLQFGKKGKDLYALDFAYPFNLEQAFATGEFRTHKCVITHGLRHHATIA